MTQLSLEFRARHTPLIASFKASLIHTSIVDTNDDKIIKLLLLVLWTLCVSEAIQTEI
jgi:hypothetical protein